MGRSAHTWRARWGRYQGSSRAYGRSTVPPPAFVARLARRIASFPADAVRSAKRVLNELTLPSADAIRADARRFHQLVASDAAKGRTAALFMQGLQTRGPLELDLGDRVGAL